MPLLTELENIFWMRYYKDVAPDGAGLKSVGSGSGTMLPQATIWYAVIVNQVGRARCSRKSQRDFIIQPSVGRRSRPTLGGRADVKQP